MNTRATRLLVPLAACLAAGCMDAGEPGNLVPKTVIEDPSLPRFAINGTVVHGEAVGPVGAPTIVVLHGGPGVDYRSLLPLQALAADGYRVVFWDHRGAGLSPRFDADSYSYAQILEDLRQIVETQTSAGQPFAFIGHSWGAMYATWFIDTYGTYGDRLRGAILSEPGAFTKAELDDFLDGFMKSVDLTGEQFNDATWARQFMSADDHARADYLGMLFSLRGVPAEQNDRTKQTPKWRYGAVMNEALLDLAKKQPFDWTTHLRAFTQPVLFLRGSRNKVATLEHQQKLAAHYPRAELVTIPDAGHEVVWEQPEAYLAHVRSYFASIGFSGGAP